MPALPRWETLITDRYIDYKGIPFSLREVQGGNEGISKSPLNILGE